MRKVKKAIGFALAMAMIVAGNFAPFSAKAADSYISSSSGIDLYTQEIPKYAQTNINDEATKNYLSDVKNAICIKVDSPFALAYHQQVRIDETNKNITPVMADGEVLAPADFLARTLGLDIIHTENGVIISNATTTIELIAGAQNANRDGVWETIDTPANFYNGVIMIPVRYVAKSFGKKVFWDDMGLMIISDTTLYLSRESNLNKIREIIEAFIYERPARETIKADLLEKTPNHPRLLATADDFARIRGYMQTDENVRKWVSQLIAKADGYVAAAPNEGRHTYVVDAGGRLKYSYDIQDKATSMGMAYQLTGDKKYSDAIWYTLRDLCDRSLWKHWHPGHFLNTADVMWGVAIAYDWMYDGWTDGQRTIIEEALFDCGIEDGITTYHGAEDYLSPPMGVWQRSQWWNQGSNWNPVGNSGVLAVGIAMATHEKYGDLAIKCIDYALNAAECGLRCYAPDGGYEEGVSYWTYGTTHAIMLIEALNVATGSSYGLADAPGFKDTCAMPLYMESKWGSFNFSDGAVVRTETESLFWFGKEYNNAHINGVRFNELVSGEKPSSYKDILWYNADNIDKDASLELDYKFYKLDTFTMRSSWTDKNQLFAGLHGGSNTAYHCHLDSGTFVFDALDQRWFIDLGTDNYNLPNYFDGGTGGKKWQYYSQRAEAHNCFVINPGLSEDQVVESVSPITEFVSGMDGAYGKINLTPAYANDVNKAERGMMMVNNRSAVIIQDEITMKKPSEFYWFANTRADVAISSDGRSAILTKNGKQIRVEIVSANSAFKFTLMDAVKLPTSPTGETTSSQKEIPATGVKKLVIKASGISNVKLAVVMQPVSNNYVYSYTNLDDWEIIETQALDIKVNGQSVKGFSPNKMSYDVVLPYGTQSVENINAVVEDGCEYTVTLPETIPGQAFIKVISKQNSAVYTVYTLNIRAAKGIEIEASGAEEGNPPENCLDGYLATRWAVEGEATGTFTFGEPRLVSSVWLAAWKSDIRKLNFDIEVSEDGKKFTQVWSGQSTYNKDELEEFKIPAGIYKAIRLVLHGNTVNMWNSLLEVDFSGQVPEGMALINIDNSAGTGLLVNSKSKDKKVAVLAKTGSNINLTARGNGKFMYWIDADTNTILGYNKSFSYSVGSARNIKTVYADSSDICVKFTSMKDKLAGVGVAGEISVPADPYLYGYTFKGWYISYSKIDFENGIANPDESTEYKAGFVKNDTKYAVVIDGVARERLYNEKVEVMADAEKNGIAFSYWMRDGEIVSYSAQYSFYTDGDTTLESVYGAGNEAKSVLVMGTPVQTDDRRIAFFAECDISTEYTVIETGMLMGSKPGLNRADEPLKLISKNVKNKGQFTGRRANVVSANTYYAVAYAVVKDSAGNISVIYSNEVSCTAR